MVNEPADLLPIRDVPLIDVGALAEWLAFPDLAEYLSASEIPTVSVNGDRFVSLADYKEVLRKALEFHRSGLPAAAAAPNSLPAPVPSAANQATDGHALGLSGHW